MDEAERVLAALDGPCSVCGTRFSRAPIVRWGDGHRTWRTAGPGYTLHEEGGSWCRLQANARKNFAATQPPR